MSFLPPKHQCHSIKKAQNINPNQWLILCLCSASDWKPICSLSPSLKLYWTDRPYLIDSGSRIDLYYLDHSRICDWLLDWLIKWPGLIHSSSINKLQMEGSLLHVCQLWNPSTNSLFQNRCRRGLVTVAPVSAVGRFLLQARWSGTRFQIFYVTLRFPKTLLDDL